MEIILKNYRKQTKKAKVKDGCSLSVQSSYIKDIILNLEKDYQASVISNNDTYFLGDDVREDIKLFSKEAVSEKTEEVLKLLDLNNSFLKKYTNELTFSERLSLNILRNVNKNREVIVFDNIFNGFDCSNRKRIIKVIEYLKRDIDFVVIVDEDVDVLYQLADYSVVWNKSIYKSGTCDDVYNKVAPLLEADLEVPTLPHITHLAKEKKGVKLFYSKDVRDIIKDIYKHV